MCERLNDVLKRLSASMGDMEMEWNVPMSSMTTLRLGGPADLVCSPRDEAQLRRLLKETHALHIPVTLVGNGSNLLVKDGGIRGVVLSLRAMNGITISGTHITAQAGAMLAQLSRRAAESGLAGLAFASGIPGTIGGGVIMNAGAYGGEMSQVVTLVKGYTSDGTPVRYTGAEMAFSHRASRLQHERVIVTCVEMELQPGDRDAILEEMNRLNRQRAEKQPLTIPNAGSMFKRPANGYASALIDQCGLRGLTIGGAQVSEKHAGFGLNLGGTAADYLALLARIQQVVMEKTGVMLEPEIRIVGEDTPIRHV